MPLEKCVVGNVLNVTGTDTLRGAFERGITDT